MVVRKAQTIQDELGLRGSKGFTFNKPSQYFIYRKV